MNVSRISQEEDALLLKGRRNAMVNMARGRPLQPFQLHLEMLND